jgi:phenylacetate-CoA ligase
MKIVSANEFVPEEHLNTVQLENMQTLLRHCYANVPYYRHLFDSTGFSPSDLEDVRHVEKLPILDKRTVLITTSA